jgi:hypothetical protein
VGPRAVLDAVVKRKIPSPRRDSNPRTSIVQPVAQRCTDLRLNIISKIGGGGVRRRGFYVQGIKSNKYYDIATKSTGN